MYDLAKQLEREKEKAAQVQAPSSNDAQELLQQLEATEAKLSAAVAARKESADLLRLKEAQVASLLAAQNEAQKEALAKSDTIAMLRAAQKSQSENYNMPVELEKLTQAHQAHQMRVVYLQNEIASLEEHVKTLGVLHKQSIADLEGQLSEAVAEARRLRKLLYEKVPLCCVCICIYSVLCVCVTVCTALLPVRLKRRAGRHCCDGDRIRGRLSRPVLCSRYRHQVESAPPGQARHRGRLHPLYEREAAGAALLALEPLSQDASHPNKVVFIVTLLCFVATLVQ
jgi:hypothetical protein